MAAAHSQYDAVVISDYDKEFVGYDVIDLLARQNPNIKIFIDRAF